MPNGVESRDRSTRARRAPEPCVATPRSSSLLSHTSHSGLHARADRRGYVRIHITPAHSETLSHNLHSPISSVVGEMQQRHLRVVRESIDCESSVQLLECGGKRRVLTTQAAHGSVRASGGSMSFIDRVHTLSSCQYVAPTGELVLCVSAAAKHAHRVQIDLDSQLDLFKARLRMTLSALQHARAVHSIRASVQAHDQDNAFALERHPRRELGATCEYSTCRNSMTLNKALPKTI
eukprot:2938547-Pleurochrysis_carterae.AAC.2